MYEESEKEEKSESKVKKKEIYMFPRLFPIGIFVLNFSKRINNDQFFITISDLILSPDIFSARLNFG